MMLAPPFMLQIMYDDLPFEGPFPSLWQVVYYEGVRSNHILFERDDVEAFEKYLSTNPSSEVESNGNSFSIEDTFFELFCCADLCSIQSKIKSLSFNDRRTIFFYYLRLLKNWRLTINERLN